MIRTINGALANNAKRYAKPKKRGQANDILLHNHARNNWVQGRDTNNGVDGSEGEMSHLDINDSNEMRWSWEVRIEELEKRVTDHLEHYTKTIAEMQNRIDRMADLVIGMENAHQEQEAKKDAPAVFVPACDELLVGKPEAKQEYCGCGEQKVNGECPLNDEPLKYDPDYQPCPTCKTTGFIPKPSATEGQGIEDVWTISEMEEHIKVNVKDYGSAVVVAAFYKKLYGTFPHIGLSGAQAKYADNVVGKLPFGVRSHSLPKDKIEISRKVASKWSDKYGMTEGLTSDTGAMLKEVRKALGEERGEK